MIPFVNQLLFKELHRQGKSFRRLNYIYILSERSYAVIVAWYRANESSKTGKTTDTKTLAALRHRRGGVYPRPTNSGRDAKHILHSCEEKHSICVKSQIDTMQLRGQG